MKYACNSKGLHYFCFVLQAEKLLGLLFRALEPLVFCWGSYLCNSFVLHSYAVHNLQGNTQYPLNTFYFSHSAILPFPLYSDRL